MKKDFEFILKLAGDSSKIIDGDPLAKSISELQDNELFEFDLDEVAAAGKPDIDRFMAYLKSKKG